jgi:hypothetical protein
VSFLKGIWRLEAIGGAMEEQTLNVAKSAAAQEAIATVAVS